MPGDKPERKSLQLRLDPDLKAEARAAAGRRDISMAEYVRQLIRKDTGFSEDEAATAEAD